MKRLIAPLVALLLLGAFPTSVSASITQYGSGSCTMHWHAHGDVTPFVCLTESIDFGGDKLVFTLSSDNPTLRLLHHDPGGLCSPKVYPPDDTWGDCISAVWVKLGTSDSICLFRDDQYRGLEWWKNAPTSPSGSIWTYSNDDLGSVGANDAISSVMLQQSGTSCTAL